MKTKVYNRSVTIRDNNMNRWTIEFEVREMEPCTRKRLTLLKSLQSTMRYLYAEKVVRVVVNAITA